VVRDVVSAETSNEAVFATASKLVAVKHVPSIATLAPIKTSFKSHFHWKYKGL
jgi:hypothetical protein